MYAPVNERSLGVHEVKLVVQSGPKLLELDVGKFEVEGLQEFDQMIWQHELVVLEAVDREKLLRVEVGFFDSRFE